MLLRQRAAGWARAALRPLLLAAGLLAAGLALRAAGLQAGIDAAGQHGALAFVALGAVACAVGIPRQMVAYAGGLAFGFWPGFGLALLAEGAGCTADFYWARLVARRWVVGWLQRKGGGRPGRLDRLDRFLVAHAFTTTLTLRLLPVGSSLLLSLLAGVTGVSAAPFLLASVIGYIPQTVVFALLGGGMRVSQGEQVALAVGLLVVSVALGLVLLRRNRALAGSDDPRGVS